MKFRKLHKGVAFVYFSKISSTI